MFVLQNNSNNIKNLPFAATSSINISKHATKGQPKPSRHPVSAAKNVKQNQLYAKIPFWR